MTDRWGGDHVTKTYLVTSLQHGNDKEQLEKFLKELRRVPAKFQLNKNVWVKTIWI